VVAGHRQAVAGPPFFRGLAGGRLSDRFGTTIFRHTAIFRHSGIFRPAGIFQCAGKSPAALGRFGGIDRGGTCCAARRGGVHIEVGGYLDYWCGIHSVCSSKPRAKRGAGRNAAA
jgi:hypothetical protein